MKHFSKFDKSKAPKSPPITGTLGSVHVSEPASSTSTTVTTTHEPILTATAHIAHGAGVTTAHNQASAPVQVSISSVNGRTPWVESVQAAGYTTHHELRASTPVSINDFVPTAPGLQGSTSVSTLAVSDFPLTPSLCAHELQNFTSVPTLADNDLSPVAHLEENCNNLPSSPDIGSTESPQIPLGSGLGQFANTHNLLVTGGTFNNIVNILSDNTSEGQMMIHVLQKPNSSPLFTGRKDVLEKLGKIFVHHTNSRQMPRCCCLLWGMGGIGKTQICLKFTEGMSERFSHVFWIDASSYESITMSLKGISSIPAAQNSGMDGSVESVLQWISCIQEEWLIVFDNADEPSPEVVAKFIPSGSRGNILITSRNPSMGRIIAFQNSIEISEMAEEDAISLLLKASCLDAFPEHLQAAKAIVTELGYIPLAVDHAGAYIQAGNCNINEYLRQFSLHRETLMSDAAFKGESNYNQTVYGTWDLSFKEIGKRASGQFTIHGQAAHAAILILQLCAFYHHSNISKGIFRSAAEQFGKHVASDKVADKVADKLPQAVTSLDLTLLALDSDGHWDDFIFGKGIAVLLSFSLIKKGQSSEILSVHPLMHCWSREHMSKSDQQRIYQMASIILSCAIPRRDKIQDYTLRRLIFPHIKAIEWYGSQMKLVGHYYDDKYTNFGSVMREHGDWNNAEKLEAQVLDMRQKLLGAEHPNTLRSMANLALTYRNLGKQNEAEQMEVKVMDIRKKLLGAEHRETLRSMAKLAITYSDQGKLDEAEQLCVQVMDIKKRLFGAEHPSSLRSMSHLANIYRKQGRRNKAEQLEIEAVEMCKRLLGEEHPDTLSSMGNLAITYHKQGKLKEAEQLSVTVMQLSKKLLGAEHPFTLSSMGNLANTYHSQGRWNEAEHLQVQVMAIKKRLLGAKHPSTLRSMGNLANTYCDQERWDEAEQLQAQVLEISSKLLGAEHPDTLISMKNLANIYCNQSRWNEAELLEIEVTNIENKPMHI